MSSRCKHKAYIALLDSRNSGSSPLKIGDSHVELRELGDDLGVLALRLVQKLGLRAVVARPEIPELILDGLDLLRKILLPGAMTRRRLDEHSATKDIFTHRSS